MHVHRVKQNLLFAYNCNFSCLLLKYLCVCLHVQNHCFRNIISVLGSQQSMQILWQFVSKSVKI